MTKAIRSLNQRRRKLEGAKSALSVSAAENYGLDLHNHLLSFFDKCKNVLGAALDWGRLDMGQRKTHIKQVFKYMLKFRQSKYDAKLTFGGTHSSKGVLGSATEDEVTIYDAAIESDDYEKVMDATVHEFGHTRQLKNAETTLSKDAVKIAAENYIDPSECIEGYRDNLLEEETRIIARTASNGLWQNLFKMSCHQRAA